MEKESFILYNSFYEPIKTLNDEQLGKLFRAIFNYTINGEITRENQILVAFMFIKNQLDMDNEKWKKEKEKRSEAGKKGMASRWGNKDTITNDNNVINSYNKNNSVINAITKITDNVNDNVDVNENDNVNVNVDVVDNNIISNNDLFTYLEKTFGRPLGSAEYELASKWEDNELTRYAIKQAELARVFNVKYIDKIIYSYKKDNITTIADAEKRNEEYQENKDKKGKYEYKSAFERKWEDQRRAEEIFLRGE